MGFIDDIRKGVNDLQDLFKVYVEGVQSIFTGADLKSVVSEAASDIGEVVPINVKKPELSVAREAEMGPERARLYRMQRAQELVMQAPQLAKERAYVRYSATTHETSHNGNDALTVEAFAESYPGKDSEWYRLSSSWIEANFGIAPEHWGVDDPIGSIGDVQVLKNGMDVTTRYNLRGGMGNLAEYLARNGFFSA